jgi:hypothetical protein
LLPEQPIKTKNNNMTALRMSYSPLGLQILWEGFAACKGQNELCVKNIFSKEMPLAVVPLRFTKLGLIKLRKLFGYASASKRNSLRQFIKIALALSATFAC